MSCGHNVAGLICTLFQGGLKTFTDPSSMERLSQAETSRGKINTEKHLLYAMGIILRIYMQSLVMSFILETLEELAILKNSDVRVKYSIVMG